MRWILLQLADAAFPAGGFAHSAGLEAAAAFGAIATPASLDAFVDAALLQTARGALPFVAATHARPERLAELDRLADAQLLNHVANKASRSQGRSFAASAARIFDDPAIAILDESCRTRTIHAHFAPAFGTVTRALDLTQDEALAVFLHGALRGALSAAVRLGLAGPHEAQRMTAARAPLLERLSALGSSLAPEHASQASPLVDLFGAAHDRLDVRLFVS